MASLDFVTDLTEKLSQQKIDYVLITVQRGTGGSKRHIFYDIPDLESVTQMAEAQEDLNEIIKEVADEYIKEELKAMKKPKKNRKKKDEE